MSVHSDPHMPLAAMDELRPPEAAHHLALYVVPVDDVLPHEGFNEARVTDLAARLSTEGKLADPPVAVVHAGKYVVLDGATRVTAFRRLGYPHIIIQLVDLHKQRVKLHTWYHAVQGTGPNDLLKLLARVEGLQMIELAPDDMAVHALRRRLLEDDTLGYLITLDERGFLLKPKLTPIPQDRLAVFNRMVDCYGEWGQVERTLSTDVQRLAEQLPDFAGLFVFRQFRTEEIMALAAAGHTVPAGITRFLIPGRILRLNAPLERLTGDEPLAAKRAWLDALVAKKLAERKMRYYEEPVLLLDE